MKFDFSRTFPHTTHLFFGLAVAIVAFCLLATDSVIADESAPRQIVVSASGMASAEPDMALITFGVTREARTAREALSANNQAMADVFAALEEMQIDKKDIQTSSFNISPRYHYPKRSSDGTQPPPKITGYIVTNNLAVRVRDLAKTGELLDKVVTLGVNTGGNIQFLNQDTKSILKKARTNAVENATDKAKTLASAAGINLGQLMEIRESSHQSRPQTLARASVSEAAASSVPIASGETSYTVNVEMRWAIAE